MNRTSLMAMALVAWMTSGCVSQESKNPLAESGAISLAGVNGRIDHMAVDEAGKRLFVAALGNNTVEIIDLGRGLRTGTVTGLSEPQGVIYVPESDEIVVANGGDGTVRFFGGKSLKEVRRVELKSDADNVRYDARASRIYVGYGGQLSGLVGSGALGIMDPDGGRLTSVKLPGHPESFQLEARGKRIFVNVPSAGEVAVVDREKGEVTATWPLKEAGSNFPMALDEEHHRLFVGCRAPAKMLVFDTESGKIVARLDCAGDADDIFYDADRRRVYVSGGAGLIDVFEQIDPDHYSLISRTDTVSGARTSFLISELKVLCVAAAKSGGRAAEVRVYSVP